VVPGDAVARGKIPITEVRTGPGTSGSPAQARLLLSDMLNPSEELPAGVPQWYDWSGHPRTRSLAPLRDYRAFTAWGQLYQCAGAPPAPAAAIDLRDLQAWVLPRGSRRWRRIQFSSDLGGAAFAEDYAGPAAPGRFSASRSNTSAHVVPGRNFHFWPQAGRVSLNAHDVAAVTVALEAQLAPTHARAAAPCFVLSVGGDLWQSLTAQTGVSDVGIGRFKRVESRWRLFTMTTASAATLQRSPLPLIAPAADDF
jgi:hypothetical protein